MQGDLRGLVAHKADPVHRIRGAPSLSEISCCVAPACPHLHPRIQADEGPRGPGKDSPKVVKALALKSRGVKGGGAGLWGITNSLSPLSGPTQVTGPGYTWKMAQVPACCWRREERVSQGCARLHPARS